MKKNIFITVLFFSLLNVSILSANSGAEQHLDQHNITTQQARDFIVNNLADIESVYNTCKLYGINNDMLAEILASDFPGLTGAIVAQYFDSNNLDGNALGFSENTDNTSNSPTNEPLYKYQWHLNSKNSTLNSLGYTINENADINIEQAWEITKGKGVTVAVIDDGIDPEHEDLKSNVILSYDADEQNTDATSTLLTQDAASHGNTCSGLIASPVNSIGTTGVAPEVNLIAIKQNSTDIANTIRAFNYAQENGAKVISCSWGTNNVEEALVEKLKELYDAGITVLFASGNEKADLDEEGINDESEVEWVIGVGATDESNDASLYSNYGENIDILAPGGDSVISIGLLTLDNMGDQGSSDQKGLVNTNYAFSDGTSWATPVTSGVVALMYAVNPNITPAQVRNILITTADKIGATTYDENGFDSQMFRAYGKVNALKAVQAAQNLLN